MPKPRVFISHSAKEDYAKALVEALLGHLEAEGFEVLCDQDPDQLVVGTAWRERVNAWIFRCHAAIVVFSESALTSDWVKKEVSNLLFCRVWYSDFPVLPLLVGGVTPDRLKEAKWEPDRLDEIQAVTAGDHADVLGRITARLAPVKERFGARSPLYELEILIGEQLGRLSYDALDLVAEHLGLELPAWFPSDCRVSTVSRKLLDAPLPSLFRSLNVIASLNPASASGLYDIAAPFAWVDPVAAALIPSAVSPPPPKPVGVNSSDSLTGRAYVRRGCGSSADILEMRAVSFEESPTELLDEVRELVKGWFKYREGDVVTDANLNEDLSEYRTVFLLVRYPLVDPEFVGLIRRHFSNLALFLLLGDLSPADMAGKVADMVFLLPPLRREDEMAFLRTYARHVEMLRRSRPLGMAA